MKDIWNQWRLGVCGGRAGSPNFAAAIKLMWNGDATPCGGGSVTASPELWAWPGRRRRDNGASGRRDDAPGPSRSSGSLSGRDPGRDGSQPVTRNAGRASPVVRVLPGSLDSHWQAGRTEHRQPARPDSDFESDSRPGHSSGSGRRRDVRPSWQSRVAPPARGSGPGSDSEAAPCASALLSPILARSWVAP